MQQPNDFSQLFQLAQSQAGQQLVALLQRSGGEDLQKALALAAQGDYTQAQKTISALLEKPEAKKLLQQLGGNP